MTTPDTLTSGHREWGRDVWRSDATPAAAYLILTPAGEDDGLGNNDDGDDDGDGDDCEGTSDCVKMLTVREGGAGLEVAGLAHRMSVSGKWHSAN